VDVLSPELVEDAELLLRHFATTTSPCAQTRRSHFAERHSANFAGVVLKTLMAIEYSRPPTSAGGANFGYNQIDAGLPST
jgi:hypothetical protein